jgi:GTP-binding protein of the ras superfamily involved in termination of M-phase
MSSLGETKLVNIKVGMVGDVQIGKTSFMVRYVDGKFNEDYIQTLGVNFMEKKVALKNGRITICFSIWDLGGHKEYLHMLPLVCNDAHAIFFMFDLTRRSTLSSVKGWYRQCRVLNKHAIPVLIGTKYDEFSTLPTSEQKETTETAVKYAKAMKAPLIFTSSLEGVNVKSIFKITLCKLFEQPCKVEKITEVGKPIIDY